MQPCERRRKIVDFLLYRLLIETVLLSVAVYLCLGDKSTTTVSTDISLNEITGLWKIRQRSNST